MFSKIWVILSYSTLLVHSSSKKYTQIKSTRSSVCKLPLRLYMHQPNSMISFLFLKKEEEEDNYTHNYWGSRFLIHHAFVQSYIMDLVGFGSYLLILYGSQNWYGHFAPLDLLHKCYGKKIQLIIFCAWAGVVLINLY